MSERVRRTRQLVLSWVGLSILVFVLLRVLPGSFATGKIGVSSSATEEARSALEEDYGLDVALPVQYVNWLRDIFTDGGGASFSNGRPAMSLVLDRLPVTLELVVIAMVLAVTFGVLLGIVSAHRRGTVGDHVSRAGALAGLSIPDFWQGTMLIVALASLGWWTPPLIFPSIADDPGGHLLAVLIPAIPLAAVAAANIQRMTRSAMLEVLGQDYIRTARAKGLPERIVVMKQALKNALPVVLTVAGLQFGFLLSGAVGIEIVFSIPGMGRLILESIQQRDYPVAQMAILTVGIMFTLVTYLVDLLHSYLDPRSIERQTHVR
jgi:peptide/nickel transport system permease protein